jgi:polyhydroxyalkanoate synthesis regulator phasin
MEKITLKAYAVKHKLSIFNVVKMIKSGQLQSETLPENGRDVIYVLIDEVIEEKFSELTVPKKSKEAYSLKIENTRLKKQIIELQSEIAALKNRV